MSNRTILAAVIIVVVVAVSIFMYMKYTGSIPTAPPQAVPLLYNESFASVINAFPSMSVTISIGPSSSLNVTISYDKIETTTINGVEMDELNVTASNSSAPATSSLVYTYMNGTVDSNLSLSGFKYPNGTINYGAFRNHIQAISLFPLLRILTTGQFVSGTTSQTPGIFSDMSNDTYTQTIGNVGMVITKYTLINPYPISNSSGGGQVDSAIFSLGRPENNQSMELLVYANAHVTSSSGTSSFLYRVNSLSIS